MTSQDTQLVDSQVGGVNLVLPSVNLLPPEVQEAAKFRRVQFAMGAALLGAVVVVAALDMQAHKSTANAQSQLVAAQQQQQVLQAKLASMQHVSATYQQAAAEQAMLTGAMSGEVRWSFVLNDLSMKIPSNVWLTQASVTAATPGTSGASAVTAAGGIGAITFQGVAFSDDDVANWLDAMATEKGFANVGFTSAAEAMLGTRKVVNFTSNATITPAELSNRYTSTQAGS